MLQGVLNLVLLHLVGIECVFENLFENQNESSIENRNKKKPLVPGAKPELKEGPFSPGFVLPVGKPGLKGFPNREYSLFLY